MTLQDFALLMPVVMVVSVTLIVLIEEWFNQRAIAREHATAVFPASRATLDPSPTADVNANAIRRITEILRTTEPKKVSGEF